MESIIEVILNRIITRTVKHHITNVTSHAISQTNKLFMLVYTMYVTVSKASSSGSELINIYCVCMFEPEITGKSFSRFTWFFEVLYTQVPYF